MERVVYQAIGLALSSLPFVTVCSLSGPSGLKFLTFILMIALAIFFDGINPIGRKKPKYDLNFKVKDHCLLAELIADKKIVGEGKVYWSVLADRCPDDYFTIEAYDRGYIHKNNIQTPKAAGGTSIWYVLGCMPTKDKQKVLAAYRKMTMIYHPDQGGNSERFNQLTEARDRALKGCK